MDTDVPVSRTDEASQKITRGQATGVVSPHPSAPLPEVGPPIGAGVRSPLGRTGIEVFPLALGTAEFETLAESRVATAVLDRYAQVGGNAIHVSDDAGAASAQVVGDWMRSRGVRDDMVVTARVGASAEPGLDADRLSRAVDEMLTRLATDRIDVLVLDASADPSARAHFEDALAVAERLVSSGVVRVLGAHGLDAAQLLEARVFASAGYPRIDVLDVPYSLGDRAGYEEDLRDVVLPQRIAVMPSRTVPRGFLRRDHVPSGRRGMIRLLRRRGRLLRVLEHVANEAGLTPSATAFAWSLAQPGVVAPVVDAFATHQIDDLAQGAGTLLTRAQLSRLDRVASR
ncbi:aldo/keto reductase [Microbacterium sp. G2-8]|uniref:aldo/keto reductase n=1 Tax=Microbacterium sp. G2-8 TaxID=2842454 RepID=UPI001C8ABA07|nr:aldo/keto reductase [Microbacterium sp. G2-8]